MVHARRRGRLLAYYGPWLRDLVQFALRAELWRREVLSLSYQSRIIRRSMCGVRFGSFDTKITDQGSSFEQSRRKMVSRMAGDMSWRMPSKIRTFGRARIARASKIRMMSVGASMFPEAWMWVLSPCGSASMSSSSSVKRKAHWMSL